MDFKLTIVTPTSNKTVAVNWIELETDSGSQVIQRGHEPALLILKSHQDVVFELTSGVQEVIEVPAGCAEITRNSATLVINQY